GDPPRTYLSLNLLGRARAVELGKLGLEEPRVALALRRLLGTALTCLDACERLREQGGPQPEEHAKDVVGPLGVSNPRRALRALRGAGWAERGGARDGRRRPARRQHPAPSPARRPGRCRTPRP